MLKNDRSFIARPMAALSLGNEHSSTRSPEGERVQRSDPTGLVSLGAARIVQAALKPQASIQELGELAMQDPALTLRVLSLVNSAAFGLKRSVTDVRAAASLIGLRGLRNVALSLIVADLVPNSPNSSLLLVQSLRRAEAARLLAERVGMADRDSCFSAGLLLEVGILTRAKNDIAGALRAANHSSEHRLLFEKVEGYEPHCAAGADLAQRFGLPQATIEAILHHHDPSPPNEPLSHVCWVAEKFAGAFESSAVVRAKERALKAAETLNLTEAAALSLLDEIPEAVERAAKAFQRDIGSQPNLEQLRDNASTQLLEINLQYDQTIRALEQVLKEKEALAEQLRLANEELATLAMTDPLTGLANRRAMLDALTRDLSRVQREETPLGFVLLDVDHFKRFNDEHGHLLGDFVLKAVADVLRDGSRRGDLPARYGGEEFCLVLPNANIEGAKLVAERLNAAIAQTRIPSTKGELSVTASFGVVAVLPEYSPPSIDALIQKADEALYRAKAAGRNRVITSE